MINNYRLIKTLHVRNTRKMKVIFAVLSCVILDIVLHVITSVYSTIPANPHFSLIVRVLGVEITSSLWALIAFSGVTYVYMSIKEDILGKYKNRGVRYGIAIALLWLFAMLEGVSLFGNPFIKEFVVGLSDAIPVLLLGVLLSKVDNEKTNTKNKITDSYDQKIKTVFIFTIVFLIGRYLAYCFGLIQSGIQTRPTQTFLWTMMMGIIIGIMFVLLDSNKEEHSLKLRVMKFGLFIFGLNWLSFLVFMPLVFSGFISDVSIRIMLDISLVMIASALVIIRKKLQEKDLVLEMFIKEVLVHENI